MRRSGGARGAGGGGGAGAAARAGGGGNDGLLAARNFFLSLFGGAQGGGGGNGGGARGRGGGAARPRDGEWRCQCGFATNRARRTACFSCGSPRATAEVLGTAGGKAVAGKATAASKGGWRDDGGRRPEGGPVGADGSRPIFSRPGQPTGGGKPAGGKGAAGGQRGKGKGPDEGRAADAHAWQFPPLAHGQKAAERVKGAGLRPQGAWVRPPPVTDAEGFRLVQPSRVRVQSVNGTPAAGDGADGARRDHGGPRDAPPRQLWADACSDGDPEDAVLDDLDDDERDDDERAEQPEQPHDPQTLRANFDAHARAVRDLERRGKLHRDDPALATLRAARDAAEQAWREAKEPAPLPTRMARAEAKLERAGAALSRARSAVDEFDEWADAHRSSLVERMVEADSWYRWRQRQLDDLHGEAGSRAADRCAEPVGKNAMVSSRIQQEILPELQAVVDYVQGNPEIVQRLTHIAAGIESARRELEPQRAAAAETYDIGDGETDDGRGDDDGDGTMGRGGAGVPNCGGWKPEGGGRWSRSETARTKGPVETTAAMLGKPAAAVSAGPPSSSTTGEHGGAAAAPAAAAAAAVADASPTANGGQANARGSDARDTADPAADGDDEEADGRRPKHRRRRSEAEIREDADRRRAEELMRQQQRAEEAQRASHQAGAGGFGSDTALTEAARKFVEDVQRAENTARSKGVEPRAGDRKLLELSPAELKAWMDEHLGDAAYL